MHLVGFVYIIRYDAQYTQSQISLILIFGRGKHFALLIVTCEDAWFSSDALKLSARQSARNCGLQSQFRCGPDASPLLRSVHW